MDASAYAFTYGVRRTRTALSQWRDAHWRILLQWCAGSAFAALGLLVAVLVISAISGATAEAPPSEPPFASGTIADTFGVLGRNLLVLALHAMACVAGFIAGSSLPLQAGSRSGLSRWVHERGGRIAIAFVACATAFSLSAQAYLLGDRLAAFAHQLGVAPALLLLTVLPHAAPELIALFLPLAAWILASRRGDWDQLLAATLVTVAVAVPVLIAAALVEVYVSPLVFHALIGARPGP
ncbi:MAG TPA: stage II sporulation protein M [Solirubrobacteraceae bacterium]